MNTKLFAAVAVALAAVASPAAADDDAGVAPPKSPPRLHLDAEVDPTAYVLSGYSGHLGLGIDRFRLDLGGYAMAVPQFVHGNDGYDVRFDGLGAKLQYFVFAAPSEPKGLFVGVDGGVTRIHSTLRGTSLSETQALPGVGAHVGYRFALPLGFYATPWIGVGYAFGGHDVTMNGATFHASPVTVFPAVHLGYHFI